MLITKKDLFNTMDMKNDWSPSCQLCKRIVFANGESVSIQAGYGKYCHPREDSVNGSYSDYSEFELGFPSVKPNDEIMKYAEQEENPTETVYGYVPVQLIVDWINENGGLQATDTAIVEGVTEMTSKLRPFNLQAALQGEPVMLRDGSKAYVRHHETAEVVADSWRLWGVIAAEGGSASGVTWWTKEGRFTGGVDGSQDIIGMWPKTRVVNGFEVPAPETEELKKGDSYFNSDILSEEFYDSFVWRNDDYDKLNLERGLVFLNKEDAIANAKAMLGIDPYEESEE